MYRYFTGKQTLCSELVVTTVQAVSNPVQAEVLRFGDTGRRCPRLSRKPTLVTATAHPQPIRHERRRVGTLRAWRCTSAPPGR